MDNREAEAAAKDLSVGLICKRSGREETGSAVGEISSERGFGRTATGPDSGPFTSPNGARASCRKSESAGDFSASRQGILGAQMDALRLRTAAKTTHIRDRHLFGQIANGCWRGPCGGKFSFWHLGPMLALKWSGYLEDVHATRDMTSRYCTDGSWQILPHIETRMRYLFNLDLSYRENYILRKPKQNART